MSPRILFAWLALILPQLAGASDYNYIVAPISGKYTAVVDLNDVGQVGINNFGPEIPYRIASLADATSSESIGTLGGWDSQIRAINNRGEAVGSSTTASGATHAFLYAGGRMQDLTLAYGDGAAADINDRGEIAWQIQNQAAVIRGGAVEPFGPPNAYVARINDAGAATGDYVIDGQGIHAFLYSEGNFTGLGTLGGNHSTATALNDNGSVVGYSDTGDGRSHAFLYSEGVMRDLGPSTGTSAATGINNHGQIVGNMDGRPFLYEHGRMTDLNELIADDAGVLLVSASAINERHQILAFACDPTGVFCYSSVRLDPIPAIPEPGGTVMLLAGALLLILRGSGARVLAVFAHGGARSAAAPGRRGA